MRENAIFAAVIVENICMTKEPQEGYVYILTNPSFKEDWVKIGKSSRPVDVRSKELDNTAVPLPFEIFATMRTTKYNEVEKLVHKTIDRLTDLRIRQNREFFNVDPQVALDIFRDIACAIEDAVIMRYYADKPYQIYPIVAGKNKVEYEGRLWSLSAFCGTYLPEEMHNKSESYQGPKYFSYQGETLWEIRLEREKE